MAPSGRVSVHLSSSDLASAQRVDLEVLGSGGSASAAISGETRPGAGWMQRVAVPAARDASALRITLSGADGVLGSAEHPLHEVFASDHEEARVALKGRDGSDVGHVNAIFRFFHGRSKAAGTILDEFTNLHPQMSRQTSLREQLVR
jgi:hypothetical protein